MRPFASLRRQAEFSRLRSRGRRIATRNLTLFRAEASPADRLPLVGISVSKAVGGAVVRNRVRRRIQHCLTDALRSRAPFRLLVIARPAAAGMLIDGLRAEIEGALA